MPLEQTLTPETIQEKALSITPPSSRPAHLAALYDSWCAVLTDLEVPRRLGSEVPLLAARIPDSVDAEQIRLAQLAGLDRDLARKRSSLAQEIMRLISLKTSLEEKLR